MNNTIKLAIEIIAAVIEELADGYERKTIDEHTALHKIAVARRAMRQLRERIEVIEYEKKN